MRLPAPPPPGVVNAETWAPLVDSRRFEDKPCRVYPVVTWEGKMETRWCIPALGGRCFSADELQALAAAQQQRATADGQ